MMTEDRIRQLENLQFCRWKKHGLDRLYLDSHLMIDGNSIDGYSVYGTPVHPCDGLVAIFNCKTYVDVETGLLYSEHPILGKAASELSGIPYEPDEYMAYFYDTYKAVYELLTTTAKEAFPVEAKGELNRKLQETLFKLVGDWTYKQQ